MFFRLLVNWFDLFVCLLVATFGLLHDVGRLIHERQESWIVKSSCEPPMKFNTFNDPCYKKIVFPTIQSILQSLGEF